MGFGTCGTYAHAKTLMEICPALSVANGLATKANEELQLVPAGRNNELRGRRVVDRRSKAQSSGDNAERCYWLVISCTAFCMLSLF